MGICNLINHGWTRIWFANAHRYYVMVCAVMLGGLAIAAESISITATPRYPWNGKVDLKFTIDGTSGTKYDTSFTAKDVAGGTNLTMKTLYKSNGSAANVAKEQLLPGTYNWVWDATADLGEGTVLEKVVVEGKVVVYNPLYMVIDLSGGTSAKSYPVSYLDAVPTGGWSDAYKTTKLVLRRVKKGINAAGGSMSQDMWVGVFEVTQKQWMLVVGEYPYGYVGAPSGCSSSFYKSKNDVYPIEIPDPRAWFPSFSAFITSVKEKSGFGFRIPSLKEWQYACRAGTTTKLYNGSLTSANANKVAWWGVSVSGSTAYNQFGYGVPRPCKVGSYQPNNWGLYDMHGNVSERTSDMSGTEYCYGGGGADSELAELAVDKTNAGDAGGGGLRLFSPIN